jgi:hypothetical protein
MQSAMDYHGLGSKYPGSGGGIDEAAQAAGYRALGNGNYINQSRWWEAPISGQDLQGKLDAQGFSKQQSNPENLIGSTDYLAQIQQYLNPQSIAAGGAASGTQTANPYEQRLQQLVNDPNSISDSNAYKFRFNQGQQALERSAAAKGMLGSGNTLAALAQYGQGMASDEYGAEVGRLGALSGQRDTYNLGLKGLANSEYGMRAGADQNRGALALSALSTANDQRLRANQLASNTATSTGLVRPNIW